MASEEYATLDDALYFRDEAGLYVNLYFASAVHWKERGIRLEQETRFPEE